ncbi:hypothetical protein PM082_010565 [Marasmius tenuissimus]|nr:hypothetical protein PM082_010565 [Marasmius tenuissimus]
MKILNSNPSRPLDLLCNKNIDVIFPSDTQLEGTLLSLKSNRYARGRVSIAKLVEKAAQPEGFINPLGYLSQVSVLGTRAADVWCIDSRGVLTLSVTGDTYQTLGLVGTRVSLGKGKGKEGDGRHDVLLKFFERNLEEGYTIKATTSRTSRLENVKIPHVRLSEKPKTHASEEYHESVEELLEWIGMAGLHAQRLQANDRVDPFIAVYETPSPNQVGTLTHLKWTGLLSPWFVQSVIDCVTATAQSPSKAPQFVSVLGHACTWSPVCYIPPAIVESLKPTPVRDPTMDDEDSWCLVVTAGDATTALRWMLAESVGKHDARWG